MAPRHASSGAVYNAAAVTAADATADRAIRALLDDSGAGRGVIVSAPAGAGKSHLVVAAADGARARGLRVAVGAPTNEQAFGLVRAIARTHCAAGPRRFVTFVPASDVSLPDSIAALGGVRQMNAQAASGEDLVVGTL